MELGKDEKQKKTTLPWKHGRKVKYMKTTLHLLHEKHKKTTLLQNHGGKEKDTKVTLHLMNVRATNAG